MQTFLPTNNLIEAPLYLDNKRLGKQRVEAYQILNILNGRYKSKAWINHPAVIMWKNFEEALMLYYDCCLLEWEKRGFKNIKLVYSSKIYSSKFPELPNWWKDERIFSSHRAALLYKNYKWYSQFNWKEKPELNYYWPLRKEEHG